MGNGTNGESELWVISGTPPVPGRPICTKVDDRQPSSGVTENLPHRTADQNCAASEDRANIPTDVCGRLPQPPLRGDTSLISISTWMWPQTLAELRSSHLGSICAIRSGGGDDSSLILSSSLAWPVSSTSAQTT